MSGNPNRARLSPAARAIDQEAWEAYGSGDAARAVALLDRCLEHDARLTERDRAVLGQQLRLWAQVADPDWEPPPYFAADLITPLREKCELALRAGRYDEALSHAWLHLQYTAPGTVAFNWALADLADSAALTGDISLARSACELYLSHAELLRAATRRSETPTGYTAPSREHEAAESLDDVAVAVPVRAALRGIAAGDAGCWAEILELAVASAPFPYAGPDELVEQSRAALAGRLDAGIGE